MQGIDILNNREEYDILMTMIERMNNDEDKDIFIKYYRDNISTDINETILVDLLINKHKNDDAFMIRLYDELKMNLDNYWYRTPSDIDSEYDPDEKEAKPYLKNIPLLMEMIKQDVDMMLHKFKRIENDIKICCEYMLSQTFNEMRYDFNTMRHDNAGNSR